MQEPVIHLASRSPRRAELLTQIGCPFLPLAVDVDEAVHQGEPPADYVRRMAEEKAWAGIAVRQRSLPVLGADTAVVVDDEVLGKPENRDRAIAMLERLSGRRHRVLSAVGVTDGEECLLSMNETVVTFREIAPGEAEAYWATGEPADKAGAYGIQGLGAVFVSRIEGSYSSVMGLPLFETARLLDHFNIAIVTRS